VKTRALPSGRLSLRRGVTLVEMLVTLFLLSVAMGTVTGMVTRTQRDYTRQREVIRLQENLRSAELVVTRLLRTASVDPLDQNVGKVDIDPMNHGTFDNIRVRSDYNPADGDVLDPLEDALVYTARDTLYVRWQAGTIPQPIAFPVRSIVFEYFAADGTPITTVAEFPNAVKVKYTVTAPVTPRASTVKRRESWVYLRN
jgi:prepilin-type N-terminal cleavage/methylation domain-containing protein